MIEIDLSNYNKVIPLFRHIDHSIAIVFAVLEGNSPGRVFVANASQPTSAFLFPEDSFYYITGNADDDAFCQSVRHLLFDEILPNAAEKEMILFSFNNIWRQRLDELLQEKGVIRIHRKMFDFNPEKHAAYRKTQKAIPDGMHLQPIDAELAERFPNYHSVIDLHSKRFGYCLMDGENIVSECNAIYVGGGEAEIDIHTTEEYQGKGYAQLVASKFIEACQIKGLRPNWSCWPERQASWALAKKLGFEERPDVPAHLWFEEMA
ncbi:MAG: GNAT family N-acetyltransferase [Anaerolineales bacterium]|nr:GNAT family N-acetyltransferase [Anaerolineales bacterium]